MKCPNCGNDLMEGAAFCNKCGNSFQSVQPEQPVATVVEPVAEPVENKPKSTGKIILIILLVVLFTGLGILGGFFIGKKASSGNQTKCLESKDAPKEEKKEEEKKKDDDIFGSKDKIHQYIDPTTVQLSGSDDLGKKLQLVKTIYNDNKQYLYVLVKNTDKEAMSYIAYLNYYDKAGTRIDQELDTGHVDSGNYVVFEFNNSTEEQFDHVSVTVKGSRYKSIEFPVPYDKNNVTTVKLDDDLAIYYKNNTKYELNGGLIVIFYKNNEIVYFYKTWFYKLKPNSIDEERVYLSTFPNYNPNSKTSTNYYDRYEIYPSFLYRTEDDY